MEAWCSIVLSILFVIFQTVRWRGFCLSISCDFQVAMAKVMEQGPVLVLTFMVQQIMTLRDAVGNIVEGGEVSSLII